MLFLDSLEAQVTPVALTAREYARALRQASEHGISGGAVYDALILHCARKSGAERIYTLNTSDFIRVAPELADRIMEP